MTDADPRRAHAARPHVLIVNQHGDNRGDEAAMRAMLAGLDRRLPGARFTVLHQFNDPAESAVATPQPVTYLPIRLPVVEALRLAAAAMLLAGRLPARSLAGPVGRRILDAYDDADVVVSAPGGPYFGDLYADHEAVHWFFVWMARVRRTPLALYAPSAGPFRNRFLNPVRRRGYRWFDRVVVREERSASHIRELVPGLEVEVTTDSALQDDPARVAPPDAGTSKGDVLRVAAAFRDPGATRAAHDAAVIAGLSALAERGPCRVTLLPQVHGRHRDTPYLEELAAQLRARGVDVQVAPESADSDEQRAIVAASDLVVAGRYHPAVFAVGAEVPVVVVPYEHKAHGLAEAAGLDEWVIDVSELTGERLAERLGALASRADEVRGILAERSPELRALSGRTSDVVAALVADRRPAAS
ncbi:polysaccharide pyruvyl transferase family protein [Actinomarinicola tropica]|uniref:Polysaccharide pyruvyl transferase domain-containing protein n=1 Tax=Actinomarinicola tropica TaxID=2789776 RepID=A0A5Q2RMQ2_9ACTN|nr:polysaccharide pyruvyl transferase family protein [Actinomarinicola tropica]QGG95851.1 hypothetical protein GH723_12500 [Actinomarinicola tropica]